MAHQIIAGEVMEDETPCENCMRRMKDLGVPCFYCAKDGSTEVIARCFADAYMSREQALANPLATDVPF